MPLQYSSVLDEHHACRSSAVMFDVSHLGTLRVHGAGAFAALQSTLSNDLERIAIGRAQYTHLLDADDGHVVDDIIVWWLDDEEFFVMPNASNTDRVAEALGISSPPSDAGATKVRSQDITAGRALIAVQGPAARSFVKLVHPALADVGRFRVASVIWNGHNLLVAGTGYTGEDGIEIHVPQEAAEALWDALSDVGIAPAGLGARDTLRLEAGLPLHGHDLGPGITPLHAGLQWVVGWNKTAFRGRDALLALKERGADRQLIGLTIEGRQPPRAESEIVVDGNVVGVVSSGNFSPILGHGIALAFVDRDVAERGGAIEYSISVRSKLLPARRVAFPFVAASPPR